MAEDNRKDWPNTKRTTILVDMACYRDIGEDGIELGPGPNQVTVNPGIREDNVDAFLTKHNLMFRTVTAGGFFSIGGMMAVDVHGGTVDAPIFAETASAFTILEADGTTRIVDASTPPENGWSPLQFVRVSLGGLGIVTRITLDVMPRPWATTLKGGHERFLAKDKAALTSKMKSMLTGPGKHDRMEIFYTPYAAAFGIDNFLALWWDVEDNPLSKVSNATSSTLLTACALAGKDEFGAPVLGGIGEYGAKYVRQSQFYNDPNNPVKFPPVPTSGFVAIGLDEIESQAKTANKAYSDLWLSEASQVMFMSYFFELPDLGDAGIGLVWDGLDVVARRTVKEGSFHIAAPLEFRFIRAGNSAMSGTYSDNPGATFVNLDLIGFIEPVRSADYPAALLQFFADVEREWVKMGGFPHNGKMYGFYDPRAGACTHTAAFNDDFLADLGKRRGNRLQAYAAYRQKCDPDGLFLNDYLKKLLGM